MDLFGSFASLTVGFSQKLLENTSLNASNFFPSSFLEVEGWIILFGLEFVNALLHMSTSLAEFVCFAGTVAGRDFFTWMAYDGFCRAMFEP